MSKFTSSLAVIDDKIDGHITLCFCDAVKAGKFSTTSETASAIVTDVQYWDRVDLTVLVVQCEFAVDRHNYYKSLGYTYDYEFIPHITVGNGDLRSQFEHQKGKVLTVGLEYARIY